MKCLAIIPARGGSKGVVKKNIRNIVGKPLIAYAIEAAEESKLLTDFVVSTDNDEIEKVSIEYGANVFRRNPNFATDTSTIEPVIKEIIDNLDEDFDLIILLQPTSPIREGKDIDAVINMFRDDVELESVVSLVELQDIHPARMYNLSSELDMIPLDAGGERKRRQDLKSVYLRNGAIYAVRTHIFLDKNILITNNKKGYVMPEEYWTNIDTERDLKITEMLVKEWLDKKK